MRATTAVLSTIAVLLASGTAVAQDGVTRYVRYAYEGRDLYGVLEGETIHVLDGDLFASPRRTGTTVQLSDVRLLPPTQPSKVIA
ncbi:MAG: DUF2437 domain-containing protein, partial [Gemmatimonadetes bacterium]|nr:DUF2437 domain-containing protein [Gemmatimonadota bacterium]